MRTKEEANDYRYFPDPDLLPLEIDAAFMAAATADLPELPDAMRERFHAEYGLSEYDANLLTASRELADYFETVARASGDAQAGGQLDRRRADGGAQQGRGWRSPRARSARRSSPG